MLRATERVRYGAAAQVRAKAPVAQLDRAPDFESGGQGFESLPARHIVLTCKLLRVDEHAESLERFRLGR